MAFRKFIVGGCAGILLLWCSAWAQQSPSPPVAGQQDSSPGVAQSQPGTVQPPASPGNTTTTEEPPPASSSTTMNQGKAGKERHWSGNLVDIPCMAKLLRNSQQGATSESGTGGTDASRAGAPHFVGSGSTGQAGQQPGGGITPGAGAPVQGQAPPAPSMPSQGQPANGSGMSPAQQAQMARAERVDNAARQCIASSATQNFGLAMSGGQVMQFDRDGNSKAQQALKEVHLQPGKRIKARVTGTMENNVTVKVASVEVKGKRAPGSASTSGTGQ